MDFVSSILSFTSCFTSWKQFICIYPGMDGFFSEYLTYGLYFMDKFLLIFVSPVLVCVLGDIIDKFGIFDAGILEQVV